MGATGTARSARSATKQPGSSTSAITAWTPPPVGWRRARALQALRGEARQATRCRGSRSVGGKGMSPFPTFKVGDLVWIESGRIYPDADGNWKQQKKPGVVIAVRGGKYPYRVRYQQK